jgi:hypothetical protein
MSGIGQILVASLAFLGATVAQLLSHWLTVLRRRAEQQQEALLFFGALQSDVHYACIQLFGALSLFDEIMEEKPEYVFSSDRLYLRLTPLVVEKYDAKILVAPGLIHRARFFYLQVQDIFEGLRQSPQPTITAAGRKYLISYLRYGLSLSYRFQKLTTSGGDIDEYESVDDQILIDHLFKSRFVGGGTVLDRSELAQLFSLISNKSESAV